MRYDSSTGGLSEEEIDGCIQDQQQEMPRPARPAMITLLMLDAGRHCLESPADAPCYICRAPRGHAGPHEYMPIDMVVIADRTEPIHIAVPAPAG